MAIVRAVVQSPSILLLDEPMISLDSDAQARLLTLLQSLKGNMTVLAVSYFEELEKVSDRSITINVRPDCDTVISQKEGVNHE
jgi:ABC-type lipoprotein export system ATPase subunit